VPIYTRVLKSGRQVYDVKVSVKGKQYMKRGLRTKGAATNWQRTLLNIRDGNTSFYTVRDLAWLWLEDAKLRLQPSTVTDYSIQLEQRILPVIGYRKISEIRPPQLQEIVNEASGYYRSAQKTAVVMHSMFSAAVRWGILDASPAVHIRAVSHRKGEMAYLDHDEASVLLRASDGVMRLYILLGLSTGMRPGELRMLKWGDIKGRKIRVRKSKTAAGVRTVTIPTEFADQLEEIRGTGYIFTLEGEPWTAFNLRWRFRQAVKAAGLEGTNITPHSLRHTYACWLMSEGVNIRFIQQQLGHSTIAVTMDNYGHLVPGVAEEVTDSFDAVANLYHEGSKQNGIDAG
jgi:integrase